MRIAIDAREILDRPTGVGRYLLEILRAWGELPEAAEHEFVLCAPQEPPSLATRRDLIAVLSKPGGETIA